MGQKNHKTSPSSLHHLHHFHIHVWHLRESLHLPSIYTNPDSGWLHASMVRILYWSIGGFHNKTAFWQNKGNCYRNGNSEFR